MRFYRMDQTGYAQIQATGLNLQVGHRIWGVAPESWFTGPRMNNSLMLSVRILAHDYNNGTRTAFGIHFHRLSVELKTKGVFKGQPTTERTGWSVWRRPIRKPRKGLYDALGRN